MKKILAALAITLLCATTASAFGFGKKSLNSEFVLVPTLKSETAQQNRAWVGTFQIVWNDLQNNIVKGPIKLVGDEKNVTVKELNKQRFKADMLSENTYYKTYGAISPELKQEIETGIKEKFNATSDILDMLDWTPAPDKYLVYTMLKKDFKFAAPFDKLEPSRFGKFRGKVDYFGINDESDKELDKTVNVLFYNSPDDFAVALETQGKDIVYLYRTDDNKTFDKLYSDMHVKKAGYMGWHDFKEKDQLRVPDVNLYKLQGYPELTGKQIEGTEMKISDALQTVDFKMNRKGVKLKSEAAIATMRCSLEPVEEVAPRYFYLDDTFVLFLQERDKKLPYFALRVYDLKLVNKTGKPETTKSEPDTEAEEDIITEPQTTETK